jgi:hypothetical protein
VRVLVRASRALRARARALASLAHVLATHVLAFGDELLDLELGDSDSQWFSQGGRDMAAAHLLPRAEAALRQELQRLANAVKRARGGSLLPSPSAEPAFDACLLRCFLDATRSPRSRLA